MIGPQHASLVGDQLLVVRNDAHPIHGTTGKAICSALFGTGWRTQNLPLGSKVLLVGGAASVADEGCGHTGSVR
jgi:hypothetical protein